MRWNEVLSEGVDIECNNCGEHVGKATELPKGTITCGRCGDRISNPYGYEHSKGNVEKFGRLEFYPETEEGTTQGTLKTRDGKVLGSLIQYGSKWMDYDGGKWQAYCMATKARKKGFPDKQKAVEWIVRQTRVAIKAAAPKNEEIVDESSSLLGQIPDWTGQEHGDTAPVAEFQKQTRHADMPLRAFVYRNGKHIMIVQGDNDMAFRSDDKASKWLEDNGFIDHVGTTQVNL